MLIEAGRGYWSLVQVYRRSPPEHRAQMLAGVLPVSGSGKAVANLALRLALGQVLTNGVFSVFMGDEIDASMDADRAENTSVTLGMLKLRISQILLVTHKYPVADYHVTMGSQHDILETNG